MCVFPRLIELGLEWSVLKLCVCVCVVAVVVVCTLVVVFGNIFGTNLHSSLSIYVIICCLFAVVISI